MQQQDNFSDPDPAITDRGSVEDDGGIGMIPEQGSMLDLVSDEVSCENCVHYRTCSLIAGFRGMTENWQAGGPEDEAPIDAENFAVICEEFSYQPDDDGGAA